MSLIQKPCPRRKFHCNRCGAKILNGSRYWELTVPTFHKWWYQESDTLITNAPGTNPVIIKAIPNHTAVLNNPTAVETQCRFTGKNVLEFLVPDRTVSNSTTWPDWVNDFDLLDTGVPFTFYYPFTDSDITTWAAFYRRHTAEVSFEEATLDEGNLVTAGRWKIALNVDQLANYQQATYHGDIIWWDEWHFYIDQILNGNYINRDDYQVFDGIDTHTASPSPLTGTYYAPDGFQCPIRDGETIRFTKPLPTLPPAEFSGITINSLPPGYGWPPHIPEYVIDEITGLPTTTPTVLSGIFYPEGFTRGDYLAPPYIDVRHVPR
tara:strand:+ start:1386 stop:2348 length:963 start_codon:yes stop_codon:yes gene_type:complete